MIFCFNIYIYSYDIFLSICENILFTLLLHFFFLPDCDVLLVYTSAQNDTSHSPGHMNLPFVFLCTLFLQACTSIHVCARLNLWTSVESTGFPSCTTCAPQSAPLPAALTPKATQSRRTRAACPLTACRGCFWDSMTQRSLLTKPSIVSPVTVSIFLQR